MNRRTPSSLYGDYPRQLSYFTRRLASGCWEFTGYVLATGYGQLGRNIPAHRLAWEIANDRPVPTGLVIDHVCHNHDPACVGGDDCRHRRCVNPAHLEPVSLGVNTMRGKGFGPENAAAEHCPAGHAYDEINTYWRPDRLGRICRRCRYERNAQRAEEHREENRLRALQYRRQANPDRFAIREWAASVGLPVADFGPLSRRVLTAYRAANAARESA